MYEGIIVIVMILVPCSIIVPTALSYKMKYF